MEKLPKCLIKHIFSFLDLKSQIRFSLTCKGYNKDFEITKSKCLEYIKEMTYKFALAAESLPKCNRCGRYTPDNYMRVGIICIDCSQFHARCDNCGDHYLKDNMRLTKDDKYACDSCIDVWHN